MNTVTDLPDMRTRVVDDRHEIERLRWFQTTRYFQCGLLSELPVELPVDPFVADSTYFGVYSEADEIQATARIVKTDKTPEILRHHPLYPDAARRIDAEGRHLAEVSRLAIRRETPHYRALALLTREFFRHGIRRQELLIASVGKPLVRVLSRILGIPVEVIGPQIDQYGDYVEETLPILIDMVKCLDACVRKATNRWEFFMEDLVIDLTESPSRQPNELIQTAI